MPTRARNRLAPLLAATALLLGCGEPEAEREEVVPLDQLPPAAMKAAKEKLPEITFDTAWKTEEDGRMAFEVRGKTRDGKTRDVKVTADGEVLEVD